MWKEICEAYEGRSQIFQVDVRRRLQDAQLEEDRDVRAHLSELLHLGQSLAGMGAVIPDPEFAAMIMTSLPMSYRPALSSMTAAARTVKKTVSPDNLISHIYEDVDQHSALEHAETKSSDSALYSKSNLSTGQKGSGGRGGRGEKRKTDSRSGPTCWNCETASRLLETRWWQRRPGTMTKKIWKGQERQVSKCGNWQIQIQE